MEDHALVSELTEHALDLNELCRMNRRHLDEVATLVGRELVGLQLLEDAGRITKATRLRLIETIKEGVETPQHLVAATN